MAFLATTSCKYPDAFCSRSPTKIHKKSNLKGSPRNIVLNFVFKASVEDLVRFSGSFKERNLVITLKVASKSCWMVYTAFALLQTYCLCLPTDWQGHLAQFPHWNKIQTVQPHTAQLLSLYHSQRKDTFLVPWCTCPPMSRFSALHQIITLLPCTMTNISKPNQLLYLKVMWKGFGVVFVLALAIKVSECTTCIIRLLGENLNDIQKAMPCIVQNHHLPQFIG